MPPLHRMPVFYLAAAVVLAAYAGFRTLGVPAAAVVERPVATDAGSSDTSSTRTVAPADGESGIPDSAPPESDDGIARTPEGLRRKVLVTTLDLVPRRQPGGVRQALPPLDYFSIHFVRDDRTVEGIPWIDVGTPSGTEPGWVRADQVLEWDTRLLARPTPRTGRPPLVIFRDRVCAVARLNTTPCPEHPETCPIEGEEPDRGRDAGSEDETTAPSSGFPILASEAVTLADGSTGTVHRVASLVSDRAKMPPPASPPPDMQPYLKAVYVAFALDTTASMRASIEAAKQLADRLAQSTRGDLADVTLRLGLVEYRDEAAHYGYRTRILSPFTDPRSFRSALDRLDAARGGDGSVDERVFDGVESALPPREGEPVGAIRHLDWPTGRAGELATKLLILLGDAPDHARDLIRAEALAERARRAGITIAAVRVDRPDRSRDEERRYQEQWRTLAEASYRPLDPARGYERPIEPQTPVLNAETPIEPVLKLLIADRIDRARELAALARAEAESRLDEYVNSRGLSLDQVFPVLVDLHRGETIPTPRPDPRFAGVKAPSVRTGWIAEAEGGSPLVSVEILLSRPELDLLIDELAAVQQAAQSDAATLRDLARIGTAAAAGETSFLAQDQAELTLADHLRRRRGLPPARPGSLLRQTRSDLLQADAPTRAALVETLGRSLFRLVEFRDDPVWRAGGSGFDGMAGVPYAWLDF